MSQEPIEVRLKRIDEEREKIQNKMQELSADLMVFPENYQQLSREIRILLQEAKVLEKSSSATPEQTIKIDETIQYLQDQDRICNTKASKLEDDSKQSNAPSLQATTGKLTPEEGIAEMQRLLDEAKQSPDRKLRSDNQNKVMAITSRVSMVNQNSDYLEKLKTILREFKTLNAVAIVAGQNSGQQQKQVAPDAQAPPTAPSANDLGVDEKIDNSLSVDLSTLSPFPSLDDPETTLQVGAVPVEAKVDERALPASGIDKSGLKAQLKEIAVENKWGISFPGDTIKIEDKNQSISILTTKQGMKITGSAELGSNVLDKWCDKNKFDKLDVKVSMPTVGKDIDAKSPEGDAAWKAFSNYNEKGFYVKDFPIDNFKDKPNYQDMKQKYEGMKEQVAAKQIDSPKMSG